MILSDLLRPESIAVPLRADDLEGALAALLALRAEDQAPLPERRAKCARDLAFGSRGEIARFHDDVVMVGAEVEGLDEPVLMLGLSNEPFTVTGEGRDEAAAARMVFLLLAPRKLSALRARVAPVLRRLVSTDALLEALLGAADGTAIRRIPHFMGTEIPRNLMVDAALDPVTYRVYPDTPIREVLDLMARRGIHAVPVVGDQYEVLGIITSGDALAYLVPRARTGTLEDAASEGVARDIMSRSVLCVTEDQALRDVAAQMVNRDVEQMPVVRDGELVGFVTRDTVLRTLFGPDDNS